MKKIIVLPILLALSIGLVKPVEEQPVMVDSFIQSLQKIQSTKAQNSTVSDQVVQDLLNKAKEMALIIDFSKITSTQINQLVSILILLLSDESVKTAVSNLISVVISQSSSIILQNPQMLQIFLSQLLRAQQATNK